MSSKRKIGNECNSAAVASAVKKLWAPEPQDVHAQFTILSLYHKNRMLNTMMSAFEFDGIPDEWARSWYYTVQKYLLSGYMVVTDINGTTYPFVEGASVYGQNVFYDRVCARITNPAFSQTYERTIGIDCEVIKVYDDWSSVISLLDYFAQKMANCDGSEDVNLIMSRPAWIVEVSNSAQEATAKKMLDDITNGRPAVFLRATDGALLNGDGGIKITPLNPKNNFIAHDIEDVSKTIWSKFLTAWGINNTNIDKAERVTTDEVNSNNVEISANVKAIKRNMQDGIYRVNKMFDLSISVKFPYWGDDDETLAELRENDKSDESATAGQ